MSKWIVKQRDFELDLVKYQIKPSHVNKDHDPLQSDKAIKIPAKKKILKSKIINPRRKHNHEKSRFQSSRTTTSNQS